MDFKTLFIKYQDRVASEEERKIVEEEIEKNKIINEYLAESFDALFLEDSSDQFEIKEQVTKKLRKNILYSVISVVLLYAFIMWVVSPVMSSMYYDPSKITQGSVMNDLTFDMTALTELTVPGYQSTTPLIDNKGFGRYDLVLRRQSGFGLNEERIPIQLSRNEKIGFFDYLFSYQILNKDIEKEPYAFDYEIPLEDLKAQDNYAMVFITFKKPIELLEATTYEVTYDQLIFQWMSIEHNSLGDDKIGFQPMSAIRISFGDHPNQENYPYFHLDDFYSSHEPIRESYEQTLTDVYEIHFKTLLSYMTKRRDFVAAFDKNSMRPAFYEDVLKYVDENGIKVEGLLISGNNLDLVDFIESHQVYGVQILDMKTSKYSQK